MQSSILFDPEVDERALDREVDAMDERFSEAGRITPEIDDSGLDDITGVSGGGVGGGGDGGATTSAAVVGLASKIPKPVAGVTASAALPVALAGGVGLGIASAMTSASARLQTSANLLGQAWTNVWKPIGDRVDELFIRDVARNIFEDTQNFEDALRRGAPFEAVSDLVTGFSFDEQTLAENIGGVLGGGGGAFAGATEGAAIGSIAGPGGTIVGGLIGGIGGAALGSRLGSAVGGWVDDFIATLPPVEDLPVPELPDFKWTGLPEFDAPDLPEFTWTGLPEFNVPGLPDFKWTGLPDFEMPGVDLPGLPEYRWTGLPDFNLPGLDLPSFPGFRWTGLPDFETPSLPDLGGWTNLPNLSLPDVPDLDVYRPQQDLVRVAGEDGPIIPAGWIGGARGSLPTGDLPTGGDDGGDDGGDSGAGGIPAAPNPFIPKENQLTGSRETLQSFMRSEFGSDMSRKELVNSNLFTVGPGGTVTATDTFFNEFETFKENRKDMATGGIVTSETKATVGERGPEAVLPLTEFYDEMSRIMADRDGGEDTSAVESKLDTLNRKLDRLASAMQSQTIEVDGETLGRVTTESQHDKVYDTDPTV